MESVELKKELEMNYDELVDYLLNKYGIAKYDYFCTETCKSKNPKAVRTDEGLYCHHIDEDKAILLSNDKYAVDSPFEYQKANRLVYCNVLEHLLLHIKIVEKIKSSDVSDMVLKGISGAANFICPQINDYYNNYEFKQPYLIKIYSLVENNFDDYIDILKYFLKLIANDQVYNQLITKERLSVGWDRKIVKRVYDRL